MPSGFYIISSKFRSIFIVFTKVQACKKKKKLFRVVTLTNYFEVRA